MKAGSAAGSIDDYIAVFDPPVRAILRKVRTAIRSAAPGAEESISYRIPTFKLRGRPLVYFAAYKTHIGVYPVTPPVKAKFAKEVAGYEGGKGTLRFPLDEPIPYALIGRIVKFMAGYEAEP